MYICSRYDKVINQNQVNYEPKNTHWGQNRQDFKMGCLVCNHNRSIYNRKFNLIMEKQAKKTHQEMLINKLEVMKLKKSMEIDEINQLINKLKTK